MSKLICLMLIVFLMTLSHSQTVDCIKYINSTYANPTSCLSSSTSTRPINATAYVKALKNTTWYGMDDWNPYIVRNHTIVRDLFNQEGNCFTAQPPKQSWIAGKTYEFSVKCTLLIFQLQIGDVIYFDLFQHDKHKAAECSFFVPIPGYSSQEDIGFDNQAMMKLEKQIQELKEKKKSKNLNIQIQ